MRYDVRLVYWSRTKMDSIVFCGVETGVVVINHLAERGKSMRVYHIDKELNNKRVIPWDSWFFTASTYAD